MGQQHSKDESLYQQVNYGNIQGIKSLRSDGAGLEWVDKEGKTPLILACMNPELYNVAKTLIELGANVNAYRPGRHAGTPLHHAAKRGLESTVRLLLSHGANALMINDDCQTPLDIAREKGFGNVVRAIESHICLFSGWLREFYGLGLGFLKSLAPKLLSRSVWVVILPCGARNLTAPIKLELAIYSSTQDAKPRTVISLWKANLEESKLNLPDPSVQIVDNTTISRGRRRKRRHLPQTLRQTRTKFAPGNEGDRQQLQLFCDACKGIPQGAPPFLNNPPPPIVQATAPPHPEHVHDDLDLAMAMSASMQSEASTSTNWNNNIPIPTAPPIMDENDPIHYPSIDSNPINPSSSQVIGNIDGVEYETKVDGESSSCVICLDAAVEGACVPCGHMCGCMSCLEDIKAKKWGCPVCRSKITQIIRVYAV